MVPLTAQSCFSKQYLRISGKKLKFYSFYNHHNKKNQPAIPFSNWITRNWEQCSGFTLLWLWCQILYFLTKHLLLKPVHDLEPCSQRHFPFQETQVLFTCEKQLSIGQCPNSPGWMKGPLWSAFYYSCPWISFTSSPAPEWQAGP